MPPYKVSIRLTLKGIGERKAFLAREINMPYIPQQGQVLIFGPPVGGQIVERIGWDVDDEELLAFCEMTAPGDGWTINVTPYVDAGWSLLAEVKK